MADNEELHPVVQLLLKRMESHPEEFGDSHDNEGYIDVTYGRWWRAMNAIRDHGSEAEQAAIREAMRIIHLEQAHVWALDELCNGEERRKEKERMEEELRKQKQSSLYAQTAYAQAQQLSGMSIQQATLNQYANAASGLSAANVTSANSLQLGKETLDESTVSKIKKALGI
jgi:hypothetical protein